MESEVEEWKCPRCGGRGRAYVEARGQRKYVYFAHYEGGKVRKCYLGPAGSYDHAEGLLSLSLKGLKDVDPYEVAVNAIVKIASSDNVSDRVVKLKKLLDVIMKYLSRRAVIKELIEKLANDRTLSVEDRKRMLKEIAEEAKLYVIALS